MTTIAPQQATVITNLLDDIMLPPRGILSQTLYNDEGLRLVRFDFAEGQELSEHTAAVPVVVQVIKGSARLVLGEQEVVADPGVWVRIPARLAHSVLATAPTTLLLTMLKGE